MSTNSDAKKEATADAGDGAQPNARPVATYDVLTVLPTACRAEVDDAFENAVAQLKRAATPSGTKAVPRKLSDGEERVLLDSVVEELGRISAAEEGTAWAAALKRGAAIHSVAVRLNPNGAKRAKDDACRRIAGTAGCPFQYSQVRNLLWFFRLWLSLGGDKGLAPVLTLSHYVAVLPLKSLEKQRRFLEEALQKGWSVGKLKSRVKAAMPTKPAPFDWSRRLDDVPKIFMSSMAVIVPAMRKANGNPNVEQLRALKGVRDFIDSLLGRQEKIAA